MKYLIISTNKYITQTNEINELIKSLGEESEVFIEENNLNYVNKIIESSKKIVSMNREGIAMITIDETGGLGFVAASKVKGMIASQISDEHSSHMTREHNGSVGLNLGGDITAIPLIKSIVELYVKERFAAGRHMVRVDMMCEMA